MNCDADHTGARPALEPALVVANDRVGTGVGLLVLETPRVAAHVRPGQFVHLRVARGRDFILRRPFSVHRVSGDRIEILYQVLGVGTREMATASPGAEMDLIGPLGRGWAVPERLEHALLVAGGLGAAPLGMLAEELATAGVAVTVALGAPTAVRLVAREVFERTARRVEVATEDGSSGEAGLVTKVTGRLLAADTFDVAYVCGPEAMQRAVAEQCSSAGVACQVSLERLMACGIGACLSCVVTTTTGLKRACADGPVFDAEEVLWDATEIPPRH
ncbi:MAG: dihydroorotate dehydrogenase electron transfer subunit [Actinomycetota bacterium]|nr:dihydroorotate dehydrogenase electron transfer subunit [Actinomycetota bacterium]